MPKNHLSSLKSFWSRQMSSLQVHKTDKTITMKIFVREKSDECKEFNWSLGSFDE